MERSIPRIPQPAIDGPWRVDSYSAKLVPARNGGGFEELKLIDHGAMAIYGSFQDQTLRDMVRHSLNRIHRQPDSIVPIALNRFDLLSDSLGEAPAGYELMRVSDDGETLRLFLQELISYGQSYGQLLKESNLLWSPNGKYILPMIPLAASDFSDSRTATYLGELFSLAETTPLRPLILLEDPRQLPASLQDRLSWQAFVGKEQLSYRRDRYPMDIAPGMATRVATGISVDSSTGTARVLNGLNYEPTASTLERKRAVADDAASYEKFLEGLTDGS